MDSSTQPVGNATDKKDVKKINFSQKSRNYRGLLYYYQSGRYALQVKRTDSFTSDGRSVFHFSQGKGLFKIGVQTDRNTMVGQIKEANTTDAKELDSVSIVYLNGKLYLRHYGIKPLPLSVYDPATLQEDEQESKRLKELFEAQHEKLKE